MMSAAAPYSHGFYVQRFQRTEHAASVVLERVLSDHGPVRSVIDVGCGVGTWLHVAAKLGAEDIQGIDGPWVEQDLLVIPASAFRNADLSDVDAALTMPRRFDLAICLEVAEHVDEGQATALTQCLARLADLVLFSAAIPGQGGVGHVNEQWPGYWIRRFSEQGLVLRDTIRPAIWGDASIPWWYRQNTMLFVAQDIADRVVSSGLDFGGAALVHPELLQEHRAELTGMQAMRIVLTKLSKKLGLG